MEIDVALGLGFVTLVIAGALWVVAYRQAQRLESLSKEFTSNQIDEKIAVMFGYAQDARIWQNISDIKFLKDKIITDITALGRLKPSINPDQMGKLASGENALVDRMSSFGHEAEAKEIHAIFRSIFG